VFARTFYCNIEHLYGYTPFLPLDTVLECQRFGVELSPSTSYDTAWLVTESSERMFT
jgi:hypothetical protein